MSATDDGGRAGPAKDATATDNGFFESITASRRKVMTGLTLGVMLAALDQTVVGTSMPKVVADLGGFEHYAWVFSAYVLAVTVVVPIAGKMSDLYGRRPVFLLAMAVFLAGSMLCGLSQDMTSLILFRGLQGVGGGMLFPVAAATIADLYAPSERGKLQGSLGAVFGLASIIGPFLGGWIVDYAHLWGIPSWRWVFYVNLPLGAVAIVAVAAYFPRVELSSRPTIDYLGAGLMSAALVSLVMLTIWGGETYAWDSAQVLGLAVLSVGAFVGFVLVERRSREPLIPLGLFRDRVFALCAACMAMTAFSMFSVIGFLPAYLQGVVGVTATYSGAVLFPLMLTAIVGSALAGALVNRFGYKVFIVGGALITVTGLLVLSMLGAHPAIWRAMAIMVYLGLGFGFTLPSFIIAVQNAIDKSRMGAATSTLLLMRTLGVTVGTTVLGSLLNGRLSMEFRAHLDRPVLDGLLAMPGIDGHVQRIGGLLLNDDFLDATPAAVVEDIKLAFSDGLSWLFMLSMALSILVLVIALLIEDRRLKTAEEYHNGGGDGRGTMVDARSRDSQPAPAPRSDGRTEAVPEPGPLSGLETTSARYHSEGMARGGGFEPPRR